MGIEGLLRVFVTVGVKGRCHFCFSRTIHWHLIVLIRGLEQLRVRKLYYFRVHCMAFNIFLSEILKLTKLRLHMTVKTLLYRIS